MTNSHPALAERTHRVVGGRDDIPALLELNNRPVQLAELILNTAIPILADKGNNAGKE